MHGSSVVTENEALALLNDYRHEPGSAPPSLRDETRLVDLGIDLLDLVGLSFRAELDVVFGDEVPVALLASLKTVGDYLDLFVRWQRDTVLDAEPATLRGA